MSRLRAELQRLYAPADAPPPSPGAAAPGLTGADSRVRALTLTQTGPGSWDGLGPVWRGVQADLGWPAPAIAVTGIDGHQLWFSLARAVPAAEAAAVLEALRARYLGGVRPERVGQWPAADAAPQDQAPAPTLPPAERAPGRWSAFLAPDLAAVFADEHWLDLPPGADAQAEGLSALRSIAAEDWQRAVARLASAAQPAATQAVASPPAAGHSAVAAAGPEADPRQFLLQVMQDPAVDLRLRIEAAKALLVR